VRFLMFLGGLGEGCLVLRLMPQAIIEQTDRDIYVVLLLTGFEMSFFDRVFLKV
jgi:hypothetical protein